MAAIIAGILLSLLVVSGVHAQWPMVNDPAFDSSVENPAYAAGQGPVILLDGAHHNFFIQWGFIDPFSELAKADGYRPVVGEQPFSTEYLAEFDIVMIITALPFDFTTKTEVTTEIVFTEEEIESLFNWVEAGGSLLVFSEHAPFDQAINPLLTRFGMTSSVGTIADPQNYDKALGRDGWVTFTRENGLLNTDHPIVTGRDETEAINSVISFGGSSLSGEGFTNIFRLSPTAENRRHPTGVGPEGMGVSQALAGEVGQGRLVALGDSNGFTAMNFEREDGSTQSLGMNTVGHDWKQMVLNVLHWLSGVTAQQAWDDLDVVDGLNPTLRYGFYTEPSGQVQMGRYYFIDDGTNLRVRLAPYGVTPLELPVRSYDRSNGMMELGWEGKPDRVCRLRRHTELLFAGNCLENDNVMPMAIEVANGSESEWMGTHLPPSETDVAILDRARQIFGAQENRNLNGDRNCDDDEANGSYSIYCAMYQASIDIAGVYRHRRPAMEVFRDILREHYPGNYVHTIRDINNTSSIPDQDLAEMLDKARSRLESELETGR